MKGLQERCPKRLSWSPHISRFIIILLLSDTLSTGASDVLSKDPSAQELIEIIGRPIDGTAFQAFSNKYGLKKRFEKDTPVYGTSSFKLFPGPDFDFGFTTHLLDLLRYASDDERAGKEVVCVCSFWVNSQYTNARTFKGTLPFGVRSSDSQKDILDRLGKPARSWDENNDGDVFSVLAYEVNGVAVNFEFVNQKFSSIMLLNTSKPKSRAIHWLVYVAFGLVGALISYGFFRWRKSTTAARIMEQQASSN
jgi:hypothetical protein